MNQEQYRFRDFVWRFSLLYAAMALRFVYYGLTYFRQLDDYIQYHNYAQAGSMAELIKDLGLLAARPLAGLMDIFIWSGTYNCMIVAVLILTALYAASAVLLFALFSRHFEVSYLFFVILCLFALGFEGTYWVSASSRILPALFLSVLAVWFLQAFYDGKKRRHLLIFLLFQLLSFGFYEQAIFFSLPLALGIGLLNWGQSDARSSFGERIQRYVFLPSFIWFLNAALYLGLTSLVKDSPLYGHRSKLMLPTTPYYFQVFLPNVLGQLKSAFLGGGFFITFRGFSRGLRIIFQDHSWFYLLAALVVSLAGALLQREISKKNQPQVRQSLLAFLLGLALALAPILPFLFLENPWFSLRCTVMSFPGIALMVESLFSLALFLLSKNRATHKVLPTQKKPRTVFAVTLAFVFLVANVSELHDYRATTSGDMAILAKLESIVKYMPKDKEMAILNLNPSYLPEQNYYYHEHIHGVTESDWALTGALKAFSGEAEVQKVTPIAVTRPIYKDYDRFDEYDFFYLFDGSQNLIPLKKESLGDSQFNFYDGTGELRARIRRDPNRVGILEVLGVTGGDN